MTSPAVVGVTVMTAPTFAESPSAPMAVSMSATSAAASAVVVDEPGMVREIVWIMPSLPVSVTVLTSPAVAFGVRTHEVRVMVVMRRQQHRPEALLRRRLGIGGDGYGDVWDVLAHRLPLSCNRFVDLR
jgi:hypothetical protein